MSQPCWLPVIVVVVIYNMSVACCFKAAHSVSFVVLKMATNVGGTDLGHLMARVSRGERIPFRGAFWLGRPSKFDEFLFDDWQLLHASPAKRIIMGRARQVSKKSKMPIHLALDLAHQGVQ